LWGIFYFIPRKKYFIFYHIVTWRDRWIQGRLEYWCASVFMCSSIFGLTGSRAILGCLSSDPMSEMFSPSSDLGVSQTMAPHGQLLIAIYEPREAAPHSIAAQQGVDLGRSHQRRYSASNGSWSLVEAGVLRSQTSWCEGKGQDRDLCRPERAMAPLS